MNQSVDFHIQQIIPETSDAITFVLSPTDDKPLAYQSGQFLTLLVPIHGRIVRRSYSLSSSPLVDPLPAITIKRVANGEVSRYLLDHVRTGDLLRTQPPAGRFTLETNTSQPRDIFLVGAGSGLTPLFSLLKTALITEPKSHLVLIASNKNEKNTLFWHPLNQLSRQHPDRLTSIHLFSHPLPDSQLYPARLTLASLQEFVRQHGRHAPERAQFYLCGPLAYMRMIRMGLIFMGFREAQIHQEHFVIQPVSPAVTSSDVARPVQLIFRGETHTLTVPPRQFILKTALEQSIPLPYSCLGGVCGTCAGKCRQGRVRMVMNEVLTDREVADGWVLPCVCYPETDDVLLDMDAE